jgi:DNA replication protein DnaC
MPEQLDELVLARAEGAFKKAIKLYQKVDLLILDEGLIRCLNSQESYDLLEIVEARSSCGVTIFCAQYEPQG